MSDHIDLSEVETARTESVAAEADWKAKAEAVRKKNKEIYDRVMAGEHTGDPTKRMTQLTDHVVRRNFGLRPEAVELFRSLEERVAAHVGEPVLVISRGIDYAGHDSLRGKTDPYIVTCIRLGILKGPKLNIGDNGEWSFPTDLHVARDGGLDRVVEGPLTTASPGRYAGESSPLEGALDKKVGSNDPLIELGFGGAAQKEIKLQIAVGTAEVGKLVKETPLFNSEDLEEMLDQLMQLPAGDEAS